VHSGLTGRKTGVDTYGEYARHSGAALSGKDPSRIDRVGAYAARHAAKNVVAAGLASQREVQLTYAIGLSQPVSIQVETFGTSTIDEAQIERRVRAVCDFRPAAIVRRFALRRLPSSRADGFYPVLAAYGHVGRTDVDLPWERTDLVERCARGSGRAYYSAERRSDPRSPNGGGTVAMGERERSVAGPGRWGRMHGPGRQLLTPVRRLARPVAKAALKSGLSAAEWGRNMRPA
jgi:hypothetical protein